MLSRCEEVASYMLKHELTLRKTALHFGIGKSTVHILVAKKLPEVNATMYADIRKLLDKNWELRHIRGGLALRQSHPRYKDLILPKNDGCL